MLSSNATSFSSYENKPFLVKVFVLQEILHFKKSEIKMKNTVNENFLHENIIKAHNFMRSREKSKQMFKKWNNMEDTR